MLVDIKKKKNKKKLLVYFVVVFLIYFSDSVAVPQFTQYIYFLFAPTLIYRDNYPR